MLKTPQRLAGLCVALTMCAIGAGGALTATQAADAPEQDVVHFEIHSREFSAVQIELAPKAPASPELPELEMNPGWNC